MEVKYLGEELSVGDRFFYCNSVGRNKVKELITLWKNKVIDLQNGESAYIAVEWDTFVDEIMGLPSLRCLKAIKQGEKVKIYSVEAVDPIYDVYDEDYWLWTFSDSESSQASCALTRELCLAEYSMENFIDLLIYSDSHQAISIA
ncbi:hypothetical protein AB3R30_06885 [Leptolyngbyaceae cyanobacterium UHCC 1019]